jgi:hypothetical protein
MPAHAEVTLIEKGKLQKIVDPAAAVRQALSEPINSTPLAELARGRKSACILICDITRPVPNHLFLRPMIETMVASGIALDRIIILVATGLHRPNLGEELAELVGDPWVMERVRIENHDARATTPIMSISASPRRGERRSNLTAASSRQICASPPAWWNHISWLAGPVAARSSPLASPTTKPSAPSIPRVSWRILSPFSAI